MDRSYIVEAQCAESGAPKQVVAVVFMNSEPSKGFLADLGLCAIASISEARPLSNQPNAPTMYSFERGGKEVRIKRFDYAGKVVATVSACGEPHVLIPPVGGAQAESLIYVPSAYVISGMVRSGSRLDPVVAVLCIKPVAGKDSPKPEMKTLRRMGLDKIHSVEEVALLEPVRESAVYIFEKSPSASGVTVKRGADWGASESLRGEPQELIPRISGAAADRFVYPRNGLGKSDFPKPGASVPSSRPSSVRPSSGLADESDQRAARRNRPS